MNTKYFLCASWIQHENSGCEKKWADTRVEGFVFTCKGCTEVAALAKEVGQFHIGGHLMAKNNLQNSLQFLVLMYR